MKTYTHTSQAGVLFDHEAGFSFTAGSPKHKAMLDELAAGVAQLVEYKPPTYADKRLSDYGHAGLTAEGWLEAIVEAVGSVPHTSPKFAELWAKREAIRAAHPKTNG